ncbi:hypothetical protein BC833DRAFT_613240 [Globomyces pollinis-pini]|nr:hypothetical protein BC833DRAFT_613240 [Globomyces pollinis-pini]
MDTVSSAFSRISEALNANLNLHGTNQKNWGFYNVLLCGFVFIVLTTMEIIVINDVLGFINSTFQTQKSGSLPIIGCYFGLFIFALFFQLYGAIEANITRNTMQILAVACFNVYTLVYSLIQIHQVNHIASCAREFLNATFPNSPLFNTSRIFEIQNTTCLYVIVNADKQVQGDKSLSQLALDIQANLPSIESHAKMVQYGIVTVMMIAAGIGLFLAYESYKQQGWAAYQSVGADVSKKYILRRYHLFILFLKVNLFFFLGLMAQYVFAIIFYTKGTQYDPESLSKYQIYIVLIILVSVVYFLVGYNGAHKASLILLQTFLGFIIFNILGLCWALYSVYMDRNGEFRSTILWLIWFIVLQMITNTISVYICVRLIQDVPNGLAAVLAKLNSAPQRQPTMREATEVELTTNRMELD